MSETNDDDYYVKRICNDDIDAFEVIVRRYQRYVCGLVAKYSSSSLVEELSHEVFIHVFQSIRSYRGDGKFKSWLSTITIRVCYKSLRQKYRNREFNESDLSTGGEDWLRSLQHEEASRLFEEGEQKKQAGEVLDWALEKLSPEDRMIVSLIYLDDKPVKEVALMLGWGVSKVKVRMFRARKRLKTLFEKKLTTRI
jgi:RNA polymerase sigma-70 factor (ECF subfamily)